MGFYGTLGIAVTGLQAQSNKIGIISDNISNLNTVGYKESVANFGSLVVNDQDAGYNALGVASRSVQRVSKQGLLQNTNSTTDLAISGNGFFVVNTANDGSGQTQYTRAGSFSLDSTGNFKNSAGLFLQAWALDRQGVPNTTLQSLNIAALGGTATATDAIALGANLNANQVAFLGAGSSAELDPLDLLNNGIAAKDIIVPNSVNSIERGDVFNITTGSAQSYDFKYGGFTIGRNVTDITAAGNGDNGLNIISSPTTLGTDPITSVGAGSGDVVITHTAHGLQVGSVVVLNGASAVGAITAPQLTGTFIVTAVTPNSYTISTSGTEPGAAVTGGGTAVIATTRPYAGNIFDATSATSAFLGTTGTGNIDTDALRFTITTAAGGTTTFTYTAASPNALLGQFNNLNNLADAINSVNALTARVVNGRLHVGASDSNDAVTFANGQTAGSSGPPVQYGLDWVGELGLIDIAADTNRFSSLENLAAAIDASAGLEATVVNPLGAASLTINLDDPLDTITFTDRPVVPTTTLGGGAYTTTAGSNLVTITSSVAGLQPGDTVTLSGLLVGTYNGIPETALNGQFTVQSVGAGTFTIAISVPPGTVTAGSFGAGTETLFAASNYGSLLGQLGITDSLNSAPFPVANPTPTTGALGPAYDPAGTFTPAPFPLLLNGFTTTAGSSSVDITATIPGLQVGDIITISGLAAGTYNGIPDTDLNATFTVQAVTGTTISITVPTASGSITAGSFGLGGELVTTINDKNMASGGIPPQFSRAITVYDDQGTSHDLNIGFIKTGVNEWAAEVYAVPATSVTTTAGDGLLAYGPITFNGDGTVATIDPLLTTAMNIAWTNGAAASTITVDWGTLGLNDGLTQTAGPYNTNFANQNGAPVGELINITVDENGDVIGNYSNGENQRLFRIPLAQFVNIDGLQAINGSAFLETEGSGTAALFEANSNGMGIISASQLESSNTDLATQLTEMIIAQRSYQFNTRLIETTDTLLENLVQMGG
jgi:flagellar hook protein FlgE